MLGANRGIFLRALSCLRVKVGRMHALHHRNGFQAVERDLVLLLVAGRGKASGFSRYFFPVGFLAMSALHASTLKVATCWSAVRNPRYNRSRNLTGRRTAD